MKKTKQKVQSGTYKWDCRTSGSDFVESFFNTFYIFISENIFIRSIKRVLRYRDTSRGHKKHRDYAFLYITIYDTFIIKINGDG